MGIKGISTLTIFHLFSSNLLFELLFISILISSTSPMRISPPLSYSNLELLAVDKERKPPNEDLRIMTSS